MILSFYGATMFELRFVDLHNYGHAYSFDCDERGEVDLDALNERQRERFFYVRSLVGRDFAAPYVQRKDKDT